MTTNTPPIITNLNRAENTATNHFHQFVLYPLLLPTIIKKVLIIVTASIVFVLTTGCNDASIASRNLSKAADMFELNRRVVFYNGITDSYILSIEGRCSIDVGKKQLEVTCKTGDKSYKKHFLGISDNVTYFSEQLDSANVDVYHYRVIFKPEAILPNIDLETSVN
jgi:hypothetical protein